MPPPSSRSRERSRLFGASIRSPLAGEALWRSIRRLGPDHPTSLGCQSSFADRLFAGGRHEDAVAMDRSAFDGLRQHAGGAPQAYVYTGIALAIGLDRIGRLTEAQAISNEVASFASHRPSGGDPAFRDAEATRRDLESRA